jgi:hypothetical protein
MRVADAQTGRPYSNHFLYLDGFLVEEIDSLDGT